MENETPPSSPGGTTTENDIETVTVEASRLTDWKKLALAFALGALVYKLLN